MSKSLDDIAHENGFVTRMRVPTIQPEDMNFSVKQLLGQSFVDILIVRTDRIFPKSRAEDRKWRNIKTNTVLDVWRVIDNLFKEKINSDEFYIYEFAFEERDLYVEIGTEKQYYNHDNEPEVDEQIRIDKEAKAHGIYSQWSININDFDTLEKFHRPHGLPIETLNYDPFRSGRENCNLELSRLKKYPTTWFELWKVIDKLLYRVNLEENTLRYQYLECLIDNGYGDFEVTTGS